MKRFIAVFGVIVIITMHCLSFYPAEAAINGVDYGEMLNTYLGAAETALAASQGVTIDWSNLEFPADSDNWTDKQKAQYIVQYVGNLKKVGLYAIYDWLFGENNDTYDIISAETAAIRLANNSNISTFDIKSQLDQALLYYDQQNRPHIFQSYSDKVIARWNEYNTNYINDYLDQVNPSYDLPDVDPDVTYIQQLDAINGSGFDNFIDASTIILSNYNYNSMLIFDRTLTYYSPSYTSNPVFTGIYCFPVNSLYITGSDNTYYCNFNFSLFNNFAAANPGTGALDFYTTYGIRLNNFSQYNQSDYTYWGGWSSNVSNNPVSIQDTYVGTLSYVLDQIKGHFHNVYIYVNNVLWSTAGSNITSGLTFNLPDAVIDNSTDDGKIVAHPIYYPDAMNTDKAIDIDLDKVVDAIASRIAQGVDDITFDDLVDAGAAVKLDGTTLTNADTVVKDISVPIARAKVDTIDGVIPTIDIVPPLPPLPPLTPGDYSGEGFNGMSVLARIINATVQGLPEPLILTFFGVVFGAVILGIIKILHH